MLNKSHAASQRTPDIQSPIIHIIANLINENNINLNEHQQKIVVETDADYQPCLDKIAEAIGLFLSIYP